jgi:hypothetical protein
MPFVMRRAVDGRRKVTAATETADLECPDHAWALIATGQRRASTAASMKLVKVLENRVPETLDSLALKPAPFCREYF